MVLIAPSRRIKHERDASSASSCCLPYSAATEASARMRTMTGMNEKPSVAFIIHPK